MPDTMHDLENPMKKPAAIHEETTLLSAAHGLAAAIDLGASALRMKLVEVHADGEHQVLENLTQAVGLGKEVFLHGRISPETTDEVVGIFRKYRQILASYGTAATAHVRAVATSAVREAENREAFLDRIFLATGIPVEVASASDINRMTFMALTSTLAGEARLRKGSVLIAEVGGGVTEFLGLEKGTVKFSRTAKLGLLRLHEQVRDHRIPPDRLKPFLQGQIDASLGPIEKAAGFQRLPELLLLGGEARLAAAILQPAWDGNTPCRIRVAKLAQLTERVLGEPAEAVAARYGLPYAEAETFGMALFCQARIAALFGIKELAVSDACLRDGIIAEMTGGAAWNRELRRQVLASAVEIGEKYCWDRQHADTVAAYARKLFTALRGEHGLPAHYLLILEVAALLHDIGMYVSPRSHHKHSMYLIQNSELFGLGERHLMIAALAARYHRKSPPRPTHEEFVRLDRNTRVLVMKLAAILRVADALARSHTPRRRELQFVVEGSRLLINIPGSAADWALEEVSVQEKGAMFKDVFGLEPVLREA